MHPYVASLKELFEQNADPVQAAPMKKYMRDQFDYLGIKSPLFRVLMKNSFLPMGFHLSMSWTSSCETCGHFPSANFNMQPPVF